MFYLCLRLSCAIFFVSHVGVGEWRRWSKMLLRYCSYARLWQLLAVSAIVAFFMAIAFCGYTVSASSSRIISFRASPFTTYYFPVNEDGRLRNVVVIREIEISRRNSAAIRSDYSQCVIKYCSRGNFFLFLFDSRLCTRYIFCTAEKIFQLWHFNLKYNDRGNQDYIYVTNIAKYWNYNNDNLLKLLIFKLIYYIYA